MTTSEPTTAVHPLLAGAFAALDSAEISWCVLRGEAALFDPRGDVDLLVADAHLPFVDDVLAECGFLRLRRWGDGGHRLYVGYHRVTDRWIEIDFESDIAFGSTSNFLVNWQRPALRTDAAHRCLARRRRCGPVWVLDPDDGFWALLLHCIIDKRMVAPRHVQRLHELVDVAAQDGILGAIVGPHCPRGWDAARILESVRRNRWTDLIDMAPALTASATGAEPVSSRAAAFARGLRRLSVAPIDPRRRFSVALMGPDGAGKSTLAEGVTTSLGLPARQVYMGLWQGEGETGQAVPLVRAVIAAASRPVKSWRRAALSLYHQGRGRVVVHDRHPYDALLRPAPPHVLAKRIFFGFLAHSVPAPTLVLILDLPSDVASRRRPEEDPVQLAAAREQYLALAERLHHAEILDADRTPDELRTAALGRIWTAVLDRSRPRHRIGIPR